MSSRRSLSWSSALRDMKQDRTPAAARSAFIAAQHAERIEAMRAQGGAARGLWTTAGFDARAIMVFAVANARCARTNDRRLSWKAAMSESLKHAWACAHAARRAAAH